MAVFLAGYRNGARRQRDSKGTRTPLYLPEPAWFLDRVQTYSDPDLCDDWGLVVGQLGFNMLMLWAWLYWVVASHIQVISHLLIWNLTFCGDMWVGQSHATQ